MESLNTQFGECFLYLKEFKRESIYARDVSFIEIDSA